MSALKGFNYNNGFWKYVGFNTKKEKPKGRKNKTINPRFVELCKFGKDDLKAYLASELSKYYKNVISNDGFLFVKGTDKVCLTAHMDTTRTVEYGKRELVKDIYEYEEDGKHVIHSPQGIGGDDRCGVYMILKILEETNYRPYIIFCEDEEIGCVGSGKFAKSKFVDDLKAVRFIVQLDRRGSNDAVFYSDTNEEFHRWIEDTTGYEEAIGSCSDISTICPACGIAGVNLSCGYYNEHHDYETVKLEEMERTYQTAVKLIEEGNKLEESFEYKERVYNFHSYNRSVYGYYDDPEDDWYSGHFSRYSGGYSGGYSNSLLTNDNMALYVSWMNRKAVHEEIYYDGLESIADGWYQFFIDHPDISFNDVLDYEEYI